MVRINGARKIAVSNNPIRESYAELKKIHNFPQTHTFMVKICLFLSTSSKLK